MSKADIISNIDKIIGGNSEVTDDTHMDLVDEISDYVKAYAEQEVKEVMELLKDMDSKIASFMCSYENPQAGYSDGKLLRDRYNKLKTK